MQRRLSSRKRPPAEGHEKIPYFQTYSFVRRLIGFLNGFLGQIFGLSRELLFTEAIKVCTFPSRLKAPSVGILNYIYHGGSQSFGSLSNDAIITIYIVLK